MPFSISKDFAFSASHRLEGLPSEHQCARLHGHNYRVRVTIASDYLDDTGFVLDYGNLAPVGQYIDGALDHRHLNDVMDLNPTAEHLARRLHEVVKSLILLPADARLTVAVSETPKTWAAWVD